MLSLHASNLRRRRPRRRPILRAEQTASRRYVTLTRHVAGECSRVPLDAAERQSGAPVHAYLEIRDTMDP